MNLGMIEPLSHPTPLAVGKTTQAESPTTQQGTQHGTSLTLRVQTEREASASAPALAELRAVSKWYGSVIGVNEMDLQLRPDITGLLGPNGAGKTTVIKLLAGQLRPSLGD